MVSFSSYIGNGLSNSKERPKSNPRVTKTRQECQIMNLSFVQSGCQIIDLKLCTASKGEKKGFQFFTPPYAPTPSTPKHQPQNVGHLLFIKGIGTSWLFMLCKRHPEWPAISRGGGGRTSLHSNTLISLSKARGLQLQWSNLKHIEG